MSNNTPNKKKVGGNNLVVIGAKKGQTSSSSSSSSPFTSMPTSNAMSIQNSNLQNASANQAEDGKAYLVGEIIEESKMSVLFSMAFNFKKKQREDPQLLEFQVFFYIDFFF